MFSPVPSWRVALRIARRDVLRHKGRHALVAILIALPILAAATVDVIARSSDLEPADKVSLALGEVAQAKLEGFGPAILQGFQGENYGEAAALAGGVPATVDPAAPGTPPAEQRAALTAVLPEGDVLTARTTWTAGPRLRIGDRSVHTYWQETDFGSPAICALMPLAAGRAPAAAGEVVINRALARAGDLSVGSVIGLPEAASVAGAAAGRAQVTVTGVVRETGAAGERMMIGAPGTLLPAGGETGTVWYVEGPAPISWADVQKLNKLGSLVLSRSVMLDPPPRSDLPAMVQQFTWGRTVQVESIVIVAAAAGLVLLQVVLMAGPALAVGARRNQRMLAMVAAAGAERRHLRRLVLANAVVTGAVASGFAVLFGAVLGAVIVIVARDRELMVAPGLDLRPAELLGLAVVGTLTAAAAAMVPARQAARLDVVAALTGRRGSMRSRRGLPLLGVLVALAGAVVTVWAAVQGRAVFVVLGIALLEIGSVATTGALVSLAARVSRGLPLSLRMALRDADRHRGRTAPAVAAVMAAMAGGVAAVLYVAAVDHHDASGYTASAAPGVVQVRGTNLSAGDVQAIEQALRATLPVREVAPLSRFEAMSMPSRNRPSNVHRPRATGRRR